MNGRALGIFSKENSSMLRPDKTKSMVFFKFQAGIEQAFQAGINLTKKYHWYIYSYNGKQSKVLSAVNNGLLPDTQQKGNMATM
jgi:hypothetical protein